MVYFVCMVCQETLKRNAVDKHCQRCRDCWDLCCVDCNKIFSGEEFRSHVTCMTEAERYQGKLYRPKHGKGKKSPQEMWMETVALVSSQPPDGMSYDQKNLLNIVAGMNNVPRKLKKFTNVVNNSWRGQASAENIQFVFEALDARFKAQRENTNKTDKGNNNHGSSKTKDARNQDVVNSSNKDNDGSKQSKKRKRNEDSVIDAGQTHNAQDVTSASGKSEIFRWKKSLKQLLKEASGNSLPLKKARRKLYKVYRNVTSAPMSKDEFKTSFAQKFQGNKKFLVNDGAISVAAEMS